MDIRKKLREGLTEAMWKPNDGDGLYLEIYAQGWGRHISISLLDGDKRLGEIAMLNKDGDDFFTMMSSYGEHGYGVSLYEIAMTYIYPLYLRPDQRFVSADAQRVWSVYYYKRKDIESKFNSFGYADGEYIDGEYIDGEYIDDSTPLNHKYRGYNINYEEIIKNADPDWKPKNFKISEY